MSDLISDGAEFSCNYCTSKLKLTVLSSSSKGDSKKLANESNCMFLPPGGNCSFPPGAAPVPCPGIPSGSVSSTGQSTVKVDGQTALGTGCSFKCLKQQSVALSSPGQSVVKHNTASSDDEDHPWVDGALEFLLSIGIMFLSKGRTKVPPGATKGAGKAAVKGVKAGAKAIGNGAKKLSAKIKNAFSKKKINNTSPPNPEKVSKPVASNADKAPTSTQKNPEIIQNSKTEQIQNSSKSPRERNLENKKRDGRPSRNDVQNKQFNSAIKDIEKKIGRKLTKDEIHGKLHREVGKENCSYHDIVEIGVDLFGE